MRKTLYTAIALAIPAIAQAQFGSASYSAAQTFTDGLGGGSTTMTMAFDGTFYWSSSGGYSNAVQLAQYNSSGVLLSTYNTPLDFRSIFTNSSGALFARQFADGTIYKMTAPGVFAPHVGLVGGSLDAQSAVVLNGAGTEYIANEFGTVDRWDLAGNFIGSVGLSGWGSLSGEGNYPQGRGIAAVGNYWLTYTGTSTLSMWDQSGNRLGTTTLTGAGNSFDSFFSESYANGMDWVVDQASGTWRGYDVGLNAPALTAAPEPGSLALLGTGLGALVAMGARRRKRAQVTT